MLATFLHPPFFSSAVQCFHITRPDEQKPRCSGFRYENDPRVAQMLFATRGGRAMLLRCAITNVPTPRRRFQHPVALQFRIDLATVFAFMRQSTANCRTSATARRYQLAGGDRETTTLG